MPKAIQRATQRAEEAGVDASFVEGDVTALREAGVGSGFSLFLDVECFNHLADEQRVAVAREIDAVAAPIATILLLVWRAANRGPLPPGADEDDLTRTFPSWRITHEEDYDGEMPGFLRNVAPRWYRLEHRPPAEDAGV